MGSWSVLAHKTRAADQETTPNIHIGTTECLKARPPIDAPDCIHRAGRDFDYGLMDGDWITPCRKKPAPAPPFALVTA